MESLALTFLSFAGNALSFLSAMTQLINITSSNRPQLKLAVVPRGTTRTVAGLTQ